MTKWNDIEVKSSFDKTQKAFLSPWCIYSTLIIDCLNKIPEEMITGSFKTYNILIIADDSENHLFHFFKSDDYLMPTECQKLWTFESLEMSEVQMKNYIWNELNFYFDHSILFPLVSFCSNLIQLVVIFLIYLIMNMKLIIGVCKKRGFLWSHLI